MNTLYLIEGDFGSHGKAFIETDRDKNSRAHVIGLIRSGEVKLIKVLEIVEDEGTCRDVTDEFKAAARFDDNVEAISRALDRQAERNDHRYDLAKHWTAA